MEQTRIIKFLEEYPSTKDWIKKCREDYTMDFPMMIVDAIETYLKLYKVDKKDELPDSFKNYSDQDRLNDIKHRTSFGMK